MYCLKCGSQMAEGSKFCVACGARAENNDSVQEPAVQEVAVSTEATVIVAEETIQPDPEPVLPPQPAPPAQQPVPPAQASQPKPVQPAFTQPAPQQPAQPARQPYPNAQPLPPQPAVAQKPEKITPLPVWKYIGIFLIMGIPLVGIVMVFVWAFGSSFNRNTRNYARAVLITFLILLVLSAVGYFTIWASIQDTFYSTFPFSQTPIIE